MHLVRNRTIRDRLPKTLLYTLGSRLARPGRSAPRPRHGAAAIANLCRICRACEWYSRLLLPLQPWTCGLPNVGFTRISRFRSFPPSARPRPPTTGGAAGGAAPRTDLCRILRRIDLSQWLLLSARSRARALALHAFFGPKIAPGAPRGRRGLRGGSPTLPRGAAAQWNQNKTPFFRG